MTLASVLIQQAYREGNLIPVGTDPTAAEQAEGLARFNTLMRAYFGSGMGELLSDWVAPAPQRTAPSAANFPQLPLACDPTSDVYIVPPKNKRIIWNGQAMTIYMPEKPNDGSRMALSIASGPNDGSTSLIIDGNGRMIQGAAQIAVPNNSAPINWLYRADLANWLVVADLALTDDCPFTSDIDDLWILMLALRLCGRYGKTLSAESQAALKWMQGNARQQFQQAQDSIGRGADIPRTSQSYSSPWSTWL